ncbi:MAG: DUF4955 domain-containing protein [Alistipes sp.]
MKRIFLWVAAAAVVLQSCEKTDGIRDEIDSLRDRVAALETKVAGVNGNILALHKLMDESTILVGVTPTDTGYDIALSDGTTLPIMQGEKIEALVPLMTIDKKTGYWMVSLDKGATSKPVLFDGKPISAWPVKGGTPEDSATGVTPQLKVDADGNWLVSIDGGASFTPLLLDGKKIPALGGGMISYSIFKSVVYDAAKGTLAIELTDGQKLTLGVENTFSLTLTAQPLETFYLAQTRQFAVEQKGVKEATIQAPDGWKAVLAETTLTVTAPATAKAEALVSLSVIITSDKGYIKSTKLAIKLLNQKFVEGASKAWQDFKDGTAQNVLLDFSYAGYKHGEEAPAEVYGLGYKVYNVCDYGADPTGVKSSREALLTLLKTLKLTGKSDSGSNLANANAQAIIYFPKGRYILHTDDDNVVDADSKNQTEKDALGNNKSEEIFIRGGNWVLKGDGRDQTTLVMATPNLPNNSAEMWSSPVMINIKHNSGLKNLTTVTADAAKGTFAIEVGSAVGISSGDWVCLKLANNDPTLVAQELAPHGVEQNMTEIKTIKVNDYHQVKSVSGNKVTFFEPLMHAVESKWNWTVEEFPHYENVGVEDLTFEGYSKEKFGHHSSWKDDGAYKPLNMMRLTNSWIRRVDFLNVSEAVSIVSSANCSAYDIEISGNRGHSAVRSQGSSRVFIGKVNDHSKGYSLTNSSGDSWGTLMENAGQYHASGVSETALGTVLWNNTWGDDALFEAHSRQPRATLVDRCTGGFVQWRFGGDEAAVPNHMEDLTLWNFNATRVSHDFGGGKFQWWLSSDKWWKTMPPIIVGFHGGAVTFDESKEQTKYLESNGTAVGPESLYEAQLRLRLGFVPAWLNSLK